MTQTTVPTAPPESGPDQPTMADAHMPPQPVPTDTDTSVYATPHWNPDTNEWAPSNEQHSTWGVAEPSHGDDPTAHPMSDAPGYGGGSIPDAHMNLLDSVRPHRGPTPAPTVEHHHVVETYEPESTAVRFHQEFVAGATSLSILQQNPDRKRALIRISSGVVNSQNNNLTAVGVPATVTVPTGQTWTLQSISFLFTASAAVATRTPRVTIRDAGGRILYQFSASTNVTANQVMQVNLAPGLTLGTGGAGTPASPFTQTGALPTLVLPAGSTITADAINEDVADTITIGTVMFSLTGSGVYLMALRDGGNAAAANIGWQLNPGDPPIEIKSQAGIEAVAEAGGGATLFVYEELQTESGAPGISA